MSEPGHKYLATLAEIMRNDAKAMLHETPIDTRDNWGIPIFLPADPIDDRPELDALVVMARKGCRDVVELDQDGWRIIVDELTFQIARHLSKHRQINLPNLGLLEIAQGEQGPFGRLALAQEARP
jgi:hypothetical protein